MATRHSSIADLASAILRRRALHRRDRALLTAISGIDGSGKGWTAAALARRLEARGLVTALLSVDPWQHPAAVRFGAGERPGEHFYWNAIRFEELFRTVVEPLRATRALSTEVTLFRPFEKTCIQERLAWRDVDVILLEGIFLFRRDLRPRYDLAVWVDCPFELALARALRRNQEGLRERDLREDYARIYFQAQVHHLDRDRPRERADWIYDNGWGREAAPEGYGEAPGRAASEGAAASVLGCVSPSSLGAA